MATFDIEVYYPKSHSCQPKAAKLSWTAEHRLLSVSVASSVPGYEKPKCVIVPGPGDVHAQQVVEELITYLNEISDAANAMEQERYQKLKGDILEKLSPDPINKESSRVSTTATAEESGMAKNVGFDEERDAEEEDEETEEDRQFLDDDSDVEEEDASMYRRFDMNRTQSSPSSDPIATQLHPPSSSSLVNTTAYREESGMEEKVEFDTECDTDEEDEETEEDRHEHRSLDMDRTRSPPSSDPIATQSHAPFSKQKSKAQKLIEELDQRLRELTVIGFNSGRYDLNVLKRFLLPHLVKNGGVKFTIKKNDSFLALKTEKLKFVDILNFLAAGTSYGQFLGAYGCKQTKGHFPYEWMDSLDKLDYSQLPSQQEFYSWLKKEAISDEDYNSCQDAWKKNDMQTMRDYLVYYNNGDVVPFLEAMEKKRSFWQQQGIDMLKDAVTLPGIAMQFEMGFLKQQGLHLSTFDNEPLYNLFRQNMVGGPAIIFKRWAEVNKTNIRDNKEKTCEKIVGYDANGLYLWALCEVMPVGLYMHWKYSDKNTGKLIAAHSWREADEWLAWEGSQRGISLRTRLNNTEKRLGDKQVSVDGYDAKRNTPFEYLGCYWHGCKQCHQEADEPHPQRGKTFGYWYDKTNAKLQYLKDIGCPAQVKWGCEWKREKTENLDINKFLNQKFPGRSLRQKLKTSEKIVEEVRSGTFSGAVEVDIQVPDDLKPKFAEMTPIFKNTKISLEDIGQHMRTFAEAHDCMPRPHRSLIGSYCGNKILLASPLLKFYLEKGLVVSKVYQAVQWNPQQCFGRFGDFVSNARREADRLEGSKIKGETAKTLGNSGYGRFIMDVTRHLDVTYVQDESKVARSINSFFFRHLEELDDDVYEIKSAKKRVKMDLPIQIGFFVYQYAKLKMLQFYYDFIDHYLDRADFEYLEMDTDSAYIALAGQSLDELVKPDLKEEYQENKHTWFPRTDTAENKALDKRTPGLFKIEWQGDGFVGLNSKTYCCWGSDGDKISSKGISKKQNSIKKELYLKVLQTGESEEGENRGFRIVNQRVLTYSQFRTGFSYFYPKRQVLEDGVTTIPLEI